MCVLTQDFSVHIPSVHLIVLLYAEYHIMSPGLVHFAVFFFYSILRQFFTLCSHVHFVLCKNVPNFPNPNILELFLHLF
jgi:hypothetical protein